MKEFFHEKSLAIAYIYKIMSSRDSGYSINIKLIQVFILVYLDELRKKRHSETIKIMLCFIGSMHHPFLDYAQIVQTTINYDKL